MDYHKIYNNLVTNGQNRPATDRGLYLETHHIVPICVGGSDHYTNLTRLTVREHLFAHILLYKMYKDLHPNLVFAIWAIVSDPNPERRWSRKNRKNWVQRWIRRSMQLESQKAIQIANRIKVANGGFDYLIHRYRHLA